MSESAIYRVLVIRPDGSRKWLSDSDNGAVVWEGSWEDAVFAASERRRVHGGYGYQYEVVSAADQRVQGACREGSAVTMHTEEKINVLAEQVMGWKWPECKRQFPDVEEWCMAGSGGVAPIPNWNPFANIADAWKLVEALLALRDAGKIPLLELYSNSGAWFAVESPDPAVTHDCPARGNWTAGWKQSVDFEGEGALLLLSP
jgi:hypothetical protein